jgi:hypothetical protein
VLVLTQVKEFMPAAWAETKEHVTFEPSKSDFPLAFRPNPRVGIVYMKRWVGILALALFAIFAAGDLVRDFITNEPIRYFAVQPLRLFWVVAIAVGGGIITLVFLRLPPRMQRKVKFFAIGSAASCCTIMAGYLLYQIAGMSLRLGVLPGPEFIKGIVWSFGAAALLWFEFYRISKGRVI